MWHITCVLLGLLPLTLGDHLCSWDDVNACVRHHLLYSIAIQGHHVTINGSSVPENQDVFCSTNMADFKHCTDALNDACQAPLGHITSSLNYLCGDGLSGWEMHGQCVENVRMCTYSLSESRAWVTMESYKTDSVEVVAQCRLMKRYLSCAQREIAKDCGDTAAEWFTGYTRLMWRPLKEIISCDVYGPTGGAAGLIAGVIVGVMLLLFGTMAVCLRRPQTKEDAKVAFANRTTSTSL